MATSHRKYIILTIIVVLAVALFIWISQRWSVWFADHPEPQFAMADCPQCVQLTTDTTSKSRIVSWRTSTSVLWQTLVWVNCAVNDTIKTTAHYSTITSGGGAAVYYYASMSVLPNCQYSYWIESAMGDTTAHFYTKTPYEGSAKLLIIGDIQDKQYSGTDTIVRSIVALHKPDYIIQLGDLIERPHQAYWERYFSDFLSVATTIPTAAVVGNHDYHKGINPYPDIRTFYTFPYYLSSVNDVKYQECNDIDALKRHDLTGCTALDYGKVRVVFIDTKLQFFRQFSQRRRVKQLLGATRPDKYLIVAMHHAPHSSVSKFNNLIVRWLYAPIINCSNVSIVYAAHEHNTLISTPKDLGTTYYQSVQNFSAKDYTKAHGTHGRHYTILTTTTTEPISTATNAITRDTLTSITYTINHTPIDTIQIIR